MTSQDKPVGNVTAESEEPQKRRKRDTKPTFSCYKIVVPGLFGLSVIIGVDSNCRPLIGSAGSTQVNRGCIMNEGNFNQTCLKANKNGVAPQECNLCTSDECNSSSGLVSSILLIFVAFIAVRIN